MLHSYFDVTISRPNSSLLIEKPSRKLTLDLNSFKLKLIRLVLDPLSGCHVHYSVYLTIEILPIRGARELGRHVLPLAYLPALL